LENVDTADVSHTSHSPCYQPERKLAVSFLPYINPSSMSPVCVLDVSGSYTLEKHEGRRRSIGESRDEIVRDETARAVA
jgi:hypothetical protein